MDEKLRDQVLAAFNLTPRQKEAALARERDVVVTAGAGSGKTSTLVARYASLLAEGVDLHRVVAITFSEKAAREMRSRIRRTLGELVSSAQTDDERQFWVGLNAKMDSARISTIHSLCAEVLRAHPAEAVVDPKFEVVDESLTAALRAQVVEDTLATLVGLPEFAPLFGIFDTRSLSALLGYILSKRLEAREALASSIDSQQVICRELRALLQTPEITVPLAELCSMRGQTLMADAGNILGQQIEELLEMWSSAEDALTAGDYLACIGHLFTARRERMGLRAGARGSEAKAALGLLRMQYDELLNAVCGGAKAGDEPPSAESEELFKQALALIKPAFVLMEKAYRDGLTQLGGLDFDDLESGAARLLTRPELRELWQAQIDAVLVDEFQDTNQRQRVIVEALAGDAGRLFVVGDAKQSIYRFRRADVTVFRAIRQSIAYKGGLPVDLNETFRSHAPLLAGMNDLLREVMGDREIPSRPYFEPFAPLVATREAPREGVKPPHIEFVLGYGEGADDGRASAARGLAERLQQLKTEGQIKDWDEVTLLFRASTGFPPYENAFEEAGIPFVTVAGQGFYDRPEIRDVLNILRALADPTDDLAMAGLLRSPAFGLTDAALYQLRWQGRNARHYREALQDDLSSLSDADQERARRSVAILEQLYPLVDRVPVAALLKCLVDATDYRSILAIEETGGGGGRLWRNLDKLIEDARASGKVRVRDFLEYLSVINDAGAREGEAPAEALGAVRLMTIHKSKGLQFPVVVLADASRGSRGSRDLAFLQPELGLSFKLDPEPVLFRLAKVLEKRQGEAEEHRVLYVALTRAQEKLIINGHVTGEENRGWKPFAWLEELHVPAGLDINTVIGQAGREVLTQTLSGQPVRAWASLPVSALEKEKSSGVQPHLPEPDLRPIFAPLPLPPVEEITAEEAPKVREWRVTGKLTFIPPNVVGTMVHKAIELWLFPGDPRLLALLETAALDAGLADKAHRESAAKEAVELLSRLAAHPLLAEIDSAHERYHELPYTRLAGDHAETGYIDLVYRTGDFWHILDFKTDYIENPERRDELIEEYKPQLIRYQQVVEGLLGVNAGARICFLDDHECISLIKI
jgi:ATP-dependent exoDNAse (exonuclease V) beta subunit